MFDIDLEKLKMGIDRILVLKSSFPSIDQFQDLHFFSEYACVEYL